MATLTATDTAPRTAASHAIGVVGDRVSRRRLEAVLAVGDFEVVAAQSDVQSLCDQAMLALDLVVVVGGPEMLARGGSVELVRNLRPACPIVFVGPSDDLSLVRKALRIGADGVVSLSGGDDVLVATVAAVLAGQISVPQAIRNRIAWGTFSGRERQVLQLVASGLTNSEIADRLFLSESTVKSHLSSSFRKLGVSSRSEAAAAVLDPDTGMCFMPAQSAPSIEQQLLGASA